MSKTRILVMDVDGTLTDGKIYMGQDGESTKAFDIKDGCGISLLLPKLNIIPVIITARESKIVENRCKELNILEIHQGSKDKLGTLKNVLEKYGVGMDAVAYAGDDLPDIPCMKEVKKAGGRVLCPADAIPEIKGLANYVSVYKAGDGAIRDCITYLTRQFEDNDIEEKIRQAIDLITSGQFDNRPAGTLANGSKYTIQEYMTKEESDCVIETHRRHIDIQYMIEGCEKFETYVTNSLTSKSEYNIRTDVELWMDGIVAAQSILVPGSLIVIMNNQPHRGSILRVKKEKVVKLVCKIELD